MFILGDSISPVNQLIIDVNLVFLLIGTGNVRLLYMRLK